MQDYLKKCAAAYYEGFPIITDEAFDRLADAVGFEDVGAKVVGKAVKHFRRMYSLDKWYVGEGKQPLEGYQDKITTTKLDGASLDITYADGVLSRVMTRGDGIQGMDITNKFIGSSIIPQTISIMGIVQVTGEIASPKTIENARNYAAGALNLKSAEEFATRNVQFFAYGVYPYQALGYTQDMEILHNNGFDTVLSISDLEDIYPCDGKVVRINSNTEFEKLGYTAKFPRGAYAVKVRSSAVETTLLAVEWQVGKSGKVTPVAILEPVLVGDATVSRANLNNGSYIESLGLYIGCTVGIIRAGEIIPQVIYAN